MSREATIETLKAVLVYLAFAVVDYLIYRGMKKRWRYDAKGSEAHKQMTMRSGGLFALMVVVPVAVYFPASAIASPGAGYAGSFLLLAVGFGVVTVVGRHNSFEVDQAKADRGYRIAPARASWIDIGTLRHFQVAHNARRGRAHPDSIVAAVARDWAVWMSTTAIVAGIRSSPAGSWRYPHQRPDPAAATPLSRRALEALLAVAAAPMIHCCLGVL